MRYRSKLSAVLVAAIGATVLVGSGAGSPARAAEPASAVDQLRPQPPGAIDRPQAGANPFQDKPLPANVPGPSGEAARSTGRTCQELQDQIAATPVQRRGSGKLVCAGTSGPVTPEQARVAATSPTGTSNVVPGPVCDYAASHPSPEYYYYRRDTCMVRRTYVAVIDPRTGAEIGRTTFTLRLYAYMGEFRTFISQLDIYDIVPSPATAGATISPHIACQEVCANPFVTIPPGQPMAPGSKVTGSAAYDTTLLPTDTTKGATFSTMIWGLQFSIPGADPNPTPVYWNEYNPFVPWIRCDNLTPGLQRVGCVVWAYTSWMQYALSGPRTQLAEHIRDAQASGLPGAPGTRPLTRIWAGDDSLDNRKKACPRDFTRPDGKTCDEYPFASSKEGADTGGGSGRSFTWCSVPLPTNVTGPAGYSACMINKDHNSQGGNDLKNFYLANRVHQDDAFWVAIAP